jgi:serine/threonine protein kinase
VEIEFFLPQGPQPTEMEGLEELRRALPRSWKGFANFVMRQPGRRGQDREIDVVLITPDRVILVDLKHLRGRIENRGGFWCRGEEILFPSPAHKIRENAKIMASLIRSELIQLSAVPPVESVVVLTHPLADPSGLDQVERDRTIKLNDFLRISQDNYFRSLFTTRSRFDASNPLNSGGTISILQKFFRNGRLFEPRKTQFHGFVPTGDPEFKHRLYLEYACHQPADPNYTGLLRLWDFSVESEFVVEAARRPVAERERAVLGHIRVQDPGLYENYVLRSVRHDSEFTLRYSEIFDRLPDLERLTRFHGTLDDLPIERRIELARLLLDRVAALHRVRVAHRDLDRHSVWVDDRRSKVVLSGFGAAHFPERKSLGEARSKLLAGGNRVPEDVGGSKPGTPFQQDVFLAGALVWSLLSGSRLETIDGVPIWPPETQEHVPEVFTAWFEKSLQLDARNRYANGVEAADAFAELLRKSEKVSLEKQLERYRRDIDPISDYVPVKWLSQKPLRIYRSGNSDASFFVKSWPERSLGERRKTAARLIEFFGKADALRQTTADWLPTIEVACLCTDGLLLVQQWIDGDSLDQCNTSEWSPENVRQFVIELATAVDDLHELGLWHGDLSPPNIIVRMDQRRPRPVLVDIVDFTVEEGGKKTAAYCPPNDVDPRVRDRYAVGQIATDIADRCDDAETKALLLVGVSKCGQGAAPWLTLKALRDALSQQKSRPVLPSFNLAIETPRAAFEGDMLSDNGVFHIVKSKGRSSIDIFGFDQRITIDLDEKDAKPKHAVAHPTDLNGAAWAQRWRTFSFEGSVSVQRSFAFRFAGFDKLAALLKPESKREEPSADASSDTPVSAAETISARLPQFPVARFWKETIAVEEEIKPEMRLSEEPKFDSDEQTLVLTTEDNLTDVEIADGQSVGVMWNGNKLGDLDTKRSRGTTVVLRNVRQYRGMRAGAVLKLQSSDEFISFQRRSRAVARILERRSQIPDLISYFDPQCTSKSRAFGADVKDEDIAAYKLNDDQIEAFKHLWKYGPVGLLQGPPGTGKTRFIAAMAHYALVHARLRNVLVLSQSHEAVNTAAERILEVSEGLGGSVDLLRVGQHMKISPALRKYHARAIQDRYRELFRAGIKDRIAPPASRLGLDRKYVTEATEIEAVFGSLVRQIELCEQDIATGSDQDVITAARDRLGSLQDVWRTALEERQIEDTGEPRDVLEQTREILASRHSVHDVDSRRRLLRVYQLANEWTAVLGMRGRTLEELLARSRNLVCGTCVGIGRQGLQLEKNAFDLVIIDEAARCTPGELAVGMQSGRRILLVGDHRQLPPLFGHELLKAVGPRLGIASRKELQRSDFERAFHSEYGLAVARTLKKQYRMAPKIGRLVSEAFYPGQELKTERGDPPSYYSLLPKPLDDEVVWIDTGHSRSSRRETEVGTSYHNRREAAAVISILRSIARSEAFLKQARAELKGEEPLVGVICMYSPQVDLIDEFFVNSDLSAEFRSLVKIDTVDSYQGKENRIVIVSLVRSNPEYDVGFVRTANRINVALSRAMERLVIVGSAQMYGGQGNPLSPVLNLLRSAGRVVGDGYGGR